METIAASFCNDLQRVNRDAGRQAGPAPDPRRQRGQVLVIVVLILAALIALVGLAVDGAVLYAKQGRLQAVADAAALAAAEALVEEDEAPRTETAAEALVEEDVAPRTETDAEALVEEDVAPRTETDAAAEPDRGAARRAAELYVRLNDLSPEAKVRVALASTDSPAASQVTVTLSQVIPLHFLPIVNVETVRLSASATASRSSAVPDLVLALDSTKCSRRRGDRRCSEIREGAWALAQGVLTQGGRVGVVDYRRTARLLLSPTSEAKEVRQALSRWGRSSHRTKERNLGDAIWLAARELARLPGERPRGVLLLATGDATVGRNCCAECRCARDRLAVCDKRCSYQWCCARWAQEMAVYAWRQGVFVMALDGTGTKKGNQLMRNIADLSDDGRLNGTEAYYILAGDRPGRKSRRGAFLAALAEAARQLPGGKSVQLVR